MLKCPSPNFLPSTYPPQLQAPHEFSAIESTSIRWELDVDLCWVLIIFIYIINGE